MSDRQVLSELQNRQFSESPFVELVVRACVLSAELALKLVGRSPESKRTEIP